ncbi:hypothetical protein BXZ70DRAFT_1007676 [Cristinia sonorae]|uniref:Uncharacterized protein n=1 Tax=Cristinia sonorae TaxID=1940300 RepID=A0A8K0XR21_9AGAR|nr:hypothetical protein BXZ70DRAFT_1007676 [Cristinia sonorae]
MPYHNQCQDSAHGTRDDSFLEDGKKDPNSPLRGDSGDSPKSSAGSPTRARRIGQALGAHFGNYTGAQSEPGIPATAFPGNSRSLSLVGKASLADASDNYGRGYGAGGYGAGASDVQRREQATASGTVYQDRGSKDDATIRPDPARTGKTDNTWSGKVSAGNRIKGSLEKTAGIIIGNRYMAERGAARKNGDRTAMKETATSDTHF